MVGELDEQIDRSRRLIRALETENRIGERDREEARLSGLLAARQVLGLGADPCLHPIHRAAGVDENGRTLWRCVDCGDLHDGS